MFCYFLLLRRSFFQLSNSKIFKGFISFWEESAKESIFEQTRIDHGATTFHCITIFAKW